MRMSVIVVAALIISGPAVEQANGKADIPADQVWGNPFRGISLSAKPGKAEFKLGEEISIMVWLRNVSDQEVTMIFEAPLHNYRVYLFHSDGRPVPKTEEGKKADLRFADPRTRRGHTIMRRIKPGLMTPSPLVITVNRSYAIEKEGTYIALVMQKIRSWDLGFAVSNLATFRVVRAKEEADASGSYAGGGEAAKSLIAGGERRGGFQWKDR